VWTRPWGEKGNLEGIFAKPEQNGKKQANQAGREFSEDRSEKKNHHNPSYGKNVPREEGGCKRKKRKTFTGNGPQSYGQKEMTLGGDASDGSKTLLKGTAKRGGGDFTEL